MVELIDRTDVPDAAKPTLLGENGRCTSGL